MSLFPFAKIRKPWDVNIDWTRAARDRLFQAMVICDARLTDFFVLGELRPRVSLFTRMMIPEGREEEFKSIARPYEMQVAPKVGVNRTRPSDPPEANNDVQWRYNVVCGSCDGQCSCGNV